jgi:hypothetical protein
VYQRSQSLQPSTSQQQQQQQPQHQQYHNTLQQQQKQFFLNNYTSTNHHTKPNPNISHLDYQRPSTTKILRINSTPAHPTSTITSEQVHQQSNQKQNKQSLTLPEFPIQISYNIGESSSTSTESPAVKIDYSKFSMPATSPSIKIDLSSYNSQITTITPIQPSSSNNNNAASGLDEDYDA